MSGSTGGASKTINATELSFAIVEQLKEREGARLSELSSALGVSKSTVHNHLHTLRELDYVVEDDDRYRLGLKFLSLGDEARRKENLYSVAKPELDDLVETVGERGQVMAEENGRGVYIYQAKTDRSVQTDSHVGMSVDLYATAVGKSYLAFLPEEERADLVDGLDLRDKTDQTITDRAALEAELDEIRERGYAFNDEERIIGMRAVGCPIVTDDDRVLGAISVSGPRTRMNGEWYRREVPEHVQQAARVIGIKTTYS